jgi:hypothetical protein
MKEALSSSETSVLTRATRRNIPEDVILYSHCRENLKSDTGVHYLANINKIRTQTHMQDSKTLLWLSWSLRSAVYLLCICGRLLFLARGNTQDHSLHCDDITACYDTNRSRSVLIDTLGYSYCWREAELFILGGLNAVPGLVPNGLLCRPLSLHYDIGPDDHTNMTAPTSGVALQVRDCGGLKSILYFNRKRLGSDPLPNIHSRHTNN